MIKICDNSLVRSLSLIFKKPFNNYTSPQKKMTSKILKFVAQFYCPLFSVKYFLKEIFSKMYTFLQNEQLLNSNQSGPSDSCIN